MAKLTRAEKKALVAAHNAKYDAENKCHYMGYFLTYIDNLHGGQERKRIKLHAQKMRRRNNAARAALLGISLGLANISAFSSERISERMYGDQKKKLLD